jgi:hypothetical protein
MSTRNRVAQLYPQTLGSIFAAIYYLQGYGGNILTNLTTRRSSLLASLFQLSGIRAGTQQGDLISLLLFFQNKESRLKMHECLVKTIRGTTHQKVTNR